MNTKCYINVAYNTRRIKYCNKCLKIICYWEEVYLLGSNTVSLIEID